MKRMPNINLTEADYQIIIHAGEVISGGEAIICRSDKEDTLYKIFPGSDKHTPGLMSDNKYKKILAQYENPLENSVRPLSTLSYYGNLIGYEMTYDKNDIPLWNMRPKRNILLQYLNETKRILEYYASKDITYGDVKGNNILINCHSGQVKFCDMDNIRLGQYPIDLVVYCLENFVSTYGCIDEKADAYMHNLLTLERLIYKNIPYRDIINFLEQGQYPRRFERPVRAVIDSMVEPENFTGEYIIQYAKKPKYMIK